jgi:hypothetical protein
MQKHRQEAHDKPQAGSSGRGILISGMPQGRNSNIHALSHLPKDCKIMRHKHKDSTPLAVMLLFTDILQLLVEQTDLYFQRHFNKQARPSCLADMTLLTIMTSLSLALQMEHDLRDEL